MDGLDDCDKVIFKGVHQDGSLVRTKGRTGRGPSPAEQISREILLGRIRQNDELSTDGENWRPLRTLPQLVPEVMQTNRYGGGLDNACYSRVCA